MVRCQVSCYVIVTALDNIHWPYLYPVLHLYILEFECQVKIIIHNKSNHVFSFRNQFLKYILIPGKLHL